MLIHDRLRENLAIVRGRIADAARKAGAAAESVRLVAVTKYVSRETVQALLALGVVDLGENRVQQLRDRAAALGAGLERLNVPERGPAASDSQQSPAPNWHMIGHLQRNKVKMVLPCSRILHSLDSVRLAEQLEQQAASLDATVDVLVELNVAGEERKSGAPPEDARRIAAAVADCAHLALRGLMTMAPYDPDPESARPYFARLRELRDELRESGTVDRDCTHLSMGMSGDYQVAVEEGATIVRVGSALYEGLPPECSTR